MRGKGERERERKNEQEKEGIIAFHAALKFRGKLALQPISPVQKHHTSFEKHVWFGHSNYMSFNRHVHILRSSLNPMGFWVYVGGWLRISTRGVHWLLTSDS